MRWKRIWKKVRNDQAVKLFGFVLSISLVVIGNTYVNIIVPDKLIDSLQTQILNDAIIQNDPKSGGIPIDDIPKLKNEWLVIPSDVLRQNPTIKWFIKDLWRILMLIELVLLLCFIFMLTKIASYRKKLTSANMIRRTWYDPLLFEYLTVPRKKAKVKVKEFADDPK